MKKNWYIFVIIIVVLGVCALIYFLEIKKNQDSEDTTKTTMVEEESTTYESHEISSKNKEIISDLKSIFSSDEIAIAGEEKHKEDKIESVEKMINNEKYQEAIEKLKKLRYEVDDNKIITVDILTAYCLFTLSKKEKNVNNIVKARKFFSNILSTLTEKKKINSRLSKLITASYDFLPGYKLRRKKLDEYLKVLENIKTDEDEVASIQTGLLNLYIYLAYGKNTETLNKIKTSFSKYPENSIVKTYSEKHNIKLLPKSETKVVMNNEKSEKSEEDESSTIVDKESSPKKEVTKKKAVSMVKKSKKVVKRKVKSKKTYRKRKTKHKKRYVVKAGAFKFKSGAKKRRSALQKLGIKSQIKKRRGLYHIEVQTSSLRKAKSLRNRIKRGNIASDAYVKRRW